VTNIQDRGVNIRQGTTWRSVLRRATSEPLVHFLLVGGVILAVSSAWSPSQPPANRITVTKSQVDQLRETWISQWGRQPDAVELRGVVDDFIREEVLYREAVASGLDRNDSIVRRRLAQKVEFLAQGIASAEPSEAELLAFFDGHRDRYQVPPRIAFEHVYFRDNGGEAGDSEARIAQVRLEAEKLPAGRAAELGDRFMLQRDYPLQTRTELKNLFGMAFADRAFELPLNRWSGPVRSSYGFHLVRVSAIEPAKIPEFEEVQAQVAIDYKGQRAQVLMEEYYKRLRGRYEVYVEGMGGEADQK
jgi:peptidyl-prolyl cis-trans isomerase C